MKRLAIILFMVIILAAFTGCSRPTAIVGRWQDSRDIVEFKSDGTFTSGYYWSGGTYQLEGSDKLILSPAQSGRQEYRYMIKRNTLALTQDGIPVMGFREMP